MKFDRKYLIVHNHVELYLEAEPTKVILVKKIQENKANLQGTMVIFDSNSNDLNHFLYCHNLG